jgi:hypothetical protein
MPLAKDETCIKGPDCNLSHVLSQDKKRDRKSFCANVFVCRTAKLFSLWG